MPGFVIFRPYLNFCNITCPWGTICSKLYVMTNVPIRRKMQVGQAITDYVKFLADARDAVYRLNCDQNTAGQLADEEERKERELEAARKAVADSVNQTIRKRLDEINSSYDKENWKKDRNVLRRPGQSGRRPRVGNEGTDCRGDQRTAGT